MSSIDLAMLPTQEIGLVLSLVAWAVLTVTLWIARRVNGRAPPSLRLALWGLWMYATLRVYSASSFVWASDASEGGWFPVLRMVVLGTLTLITIACVTLLVYYWRRWR